ncbi:Hypothetical protein CAP_7039 [Chondromyces apiculatus DSM 436]|uniref:Uncharacterized protein n=1 Tax=Chondromyces apiculatus DSM 436 TaxID=1192034 RepID=A0A017TGI8_9BACT|nr:Hypothetical protein CAP_7039 [Chondromyces apiculatus DSM 436]
MPGPAAAAGEAAGAPSPGGESEAGRDGGAGDGGEAQAGAEGPVTPPVRVGGPWVRCYGNFRLSGTPLQDVTRLSLLCGPSNGMRRYSKEAVVGVVGAGKPAVTAPVPLRRGACYRVFAVGDGGIGDLEVVMRSSRGVAIATDAGEDAWPIVQPDRPFCALDDDDAVLEVSARKGAGRFAAEVWVLRSPGVR